MCSAVLICASRCPPHELQTQQRRSRCPPAPVTAEAMLTSSPCARVEACQKAVGAAEPCGQVGQHGRYTAALYGSGLGPDSTLPRLERAVDTAVQTNSLYWAAREAMIISTGIGALADGRHRKLLPVPFSQCTGPPCARTSRFEPGWQVCQASGRSGLRELCAEARPGTFGGGESSPAGGWRILRPSPDQGVAVMSAAAAVIDADAHHPPKHAVVSR